MTPQKLISILTLFVAAVLPVLPVLPARAEDPARASEQYRLQPGDEIAVSVLPRTEYGSTGTVLPDGTVQLKNLGQTRVVGMTVSELEKHITRELEKVLKRPRVSVAVVKLGRPPLLPQITVSGGVQKPGPLPLETGLRLRKALDLAGGPLPTADLSRVSVLRKDLSRKVIDLVEAGSVEDDRRNLLLEDGDSIEVPLQATLRITVTGAVQKPGPLTEGERGLRAHQALGLAGGALPDADLASVTITHADLTRTVVDLSDLERLADLAHNPVLRDGDAVHVALKYRTGFIWIAGEVLNPASYPYKPEMTLDDLIVAAGKLTLMADVRRIELKRPGVAPRTVDLVALREDGAAGKVLLAPGDSVHVPRQADAVFLIGAVPVPGPRPLAEGQTIQEFFTAGQTETLAALDDSKVDLKGAQLIRRGQPTRSVDLKAVLKNESHKQNYRLQSGDVLFLPAKNLNDRKPTTTDYLRALPFVGGLFGLF
ncbi:MAG: SLBB domain-containing protein [Armatimonadota bacterium]